MRAKLQVQSVLTTQEGQVLKMHAVCKSGGYPPDGLDEDNTFAKFSPSADFTISIRNPALFNRFKPGAKFYVDFTAAEPAPEMPA